MTKTEYLLKDLIPKYIQKHDGVVEKATSELNDYLLKIDKIEKLGAEIIWQIDGMQNDSYVTELVKEFINLVEQIPNDLLKLIDQTFQNFEKTEGYVRRFSRTDAIFSFLKEKDPEYFSFAHVEEQPASIYEWLESKGSKIIQK